MYKEIRSYNAPPLVREGRTIEGYAIVFNSRSQLMYDFWEDKRFFEVISPSAITMEFLRSCDIKFVVEHNRERLLARSNRGDGSLNLSIDSKGVKYEFEAPNTQEGNDMLELIQRGDISGSSFCFIADRDKFKYRWIEEEQAWERTIDGFKSIIDMCITTDPAYQDTDANVRSLLEDMRPEYKKPETPNARYYDDLYNTINKTTIKKRL